MHVDLSHWTNQDDDSDQEDLETLRRECLIQSTNSYGGIGEKESRYADSGGESSDTDDIILVQKIKQKFSIKDTLDDSNRLSSSCLTISDDDDDFETLRLIKRRFQQYAQVASSNVNPEKCPDESTLFSTGVTIGQERSVPLLEFPGNSLHIDSDSHSEVNCQTSSPNVENDHSEFNNWPAQEAAKRFVKPKHVATSSQPFVVALRKNRICQKFILNKMMQLETKIEENKFLKEQIKYLMDFQNSCKKRIGKMLSQNKDPRVLLISRSTISTKVNGGKKAICGPPENSHVSKYKIVFARSPFSVNKQPWSMSDREKLCKGVKQLYQEMLITNSIDHDKEKNSIIEYSNTISSFNDFDMASENFRSFIPLVNWDRLASMFFTGRTGIECESRWLNYEDPLINNDPWTADEDKNILYIAQTSGIHNWFDIAVRLGTHRTPFQCLVRYQRSLNAYILKKEWTRDEDAQLCDAVDIFGENWQLVASCLEGRTGPQCSNRWRKTLHPDRKRVGRWSIEEDKRLKVAVMLFGAKNWNKIAQFAPGRTQSQCRERWVNCLDPFLNLEPWEKEEDNKLETAIAKFGYCWSRIASFLHPRTDSQCRRRWKVLFPNEVHLLKAARKMRKTVLISNFVDREKERPLIGPDDFYYVGKEIIASDENDEPNKKRRKKSTEEGIKQKRQKKGSTSTDGGIKQKRQKKGSTSDLRQLNQPPIVIEKASKSSLVLHEQPNTFDDIEIPIKKKRGQYKKSLAKRTNCNQSSGNQDVDPAFSSFTDAGSVPVDADQPRLDYISQTVAQLCDKIVLTNDGNLNSEPQTSVNVFLNRTEGVGELSQTISFRKLKQNLRS